MQQMLRTPLLDVTRTSPGNKSLMTLFLGFTGLCGYGWYTQYQKYQLTRARWESVTEKITKGEVTELKGGDAKIYPWARGDSAAEWEHRLVNIKGFFREERFFVKRSRRGEEGYLIFAPFITAKEQVSHRVTNANPILEYGLMVCLGWVAKDKKDQVAMGSDPLPLLTYESDKMDDPFYDFVQNLVTDPEHLTDAVPLTELTGVVQLGESETLLKKNWKKEGFYQVADLDFMARFFRLFNLNAAKVAYIERVLPGQEEVPEDAVPEPATAGTIQRGTLQSAQHLAYSKYWGTLASVGLVGLSILSLRR